MPAQRMRVRNTLNCSRLSAWVSQRACSHGQSYPRNQFSVSYPRPAPRDHDTISTVWSQGLWTHKPLSISARLLSSLCKTTHRLMDPLCRSRRSPSRVSWHFQTTTPPSPTATTFATRSSPWADIPMIPWQMPWTPFSEIGATGSPVPRFPAMISSRSTRTTVTATSQCRLFTDTRIGATDV